MIAQAGVGQLSSVVYDVPDFGQFYRVGYLANDWAIRASADENTAAQSPSVVDVVGATFIFSTAANKELYLKATGYNVWNAAADLLLETPDTGREFDSERQRGLVSRSIEQKWTLFRERGMYVNRRKRTLAII
jgi:hypothetical protein